MPIFWQGYCQAVLVHLATNKFTNFPLRTNITKIDHAL
jgi:hypothetical protein